jgi:hypothetical protein
LLIEKYRAPSPGIVHGLARGCSSARLQGWLLTVTCQGGRDDCRDPHRWQGRATEGLVRPGVMNGGNSEFLLNSGVTGERRSGVKHNNELRGRAAG